MNPAGSWNSMEVEVKGRSLRASVNGKIILDVTADAATPHFGRSLPGLNRTKGRIGLQKHTGTVRFRNIQVKSLDAPVSLALARQSRHGPTRPRRVSRPSRRTTRRASGLFSTAVIYRDGRLTAMMPAAWRVEDGEIVAVGHGFANSDFLLSDHDYRDVVLRFDFKVGPNANSGVGIRAIRGERVDGRPRNLEVQFMTIKTCRPARASQRARFFGRTAGR